MSSGKTVCVIGGGIAGLAVSVFLIEMGYKITLIESSPKLGGRAYSYFDKSKNQFFDNGQHILAGWYKNTFEYLKTINSFGLLDFQNNLEVNFIDTQKNKYTLKCPDLPAPLNLITGLMKFKALNLKDKSGLTKIGKLMKEEINLKDKYENVYELLKSIKQSDNLIKYFWEPFCLAVFNTRINKISVKLFLNVLKEGFNGKSNSLLVIPRTDLNSLLINGAVEFFEREKANIILSKRITGININDKVESIVTEDGEVIKSDFYVSAVPFFNFKDLFDDEIYCENKFESDKLKSSGIISVHLFFKEDIRIELIPDNSYGMTGLIGTTVQWIFKKGSRHLSLVISGSDDLNVTGMDNDEILNITINDLAKTLISFDDSKITDYKIIKEKRATFIPDKESDNYRQSQKTNYDNLFICGDWTDTGLPSTIEGAVKSAKICAGLIQNVN